MLFLVYLLNLQLIDIKGFTQKNKGADPGNSTGTPNVPRPVHNLLETDCSA